MLEKDSDTARSGKKVGLFGVPLEPLPSMESLLIKKSYVRALTLGNMPQPDYRDPYDFLSNNLPEAVSGKYRLLGEVSVPVWLQPKPKPIDTMNLTIDLFNEFIESGGCTTIAGKVHDFVNNNVLPMIPGMIGVDHSSTYGIISALTKYSDEKLGLIVLDSHFDAVPVDLRHGLIDYAKETDLPGIPLDVYSQDFQPVSFSGENEKSGALNAENFLLHLLDDKLIDPENLVMVGITDYPGSAFEESDDPRLRNYLNYFKSLEDSGTHFISKPILDEYGTEPFEKALKHLKTKRVYISLDIDIGSLSSVYACRFLNTVGLSFHQIQAVFQSVFDFFSDDLTLAGFDLMEIDIHKLGARIDSTHFDQTGEISRLFLESIGKII